MLKRFPILLPLLFCCFSIATIAQPTLDTIKDCLKQKPHLFGRIDTRNSFINNSRAVILGVKMGLNYGNKLYFGLGYNQLYSSAKNFGKNIYFKNANTFPDSSTATLHLYYLSLHTEYVYHQTKNWKLSIPLQIGVGETYYQYMHGEKKETIERTTFFIYEPSVSIEYKIWKWCGVGSDIGFRLMVGNYKELNQKFNSPTYAFKFLIYYNELWKLFYKK